MSNRGTDVSPELTEVRTVLSRAETARDRIAELSYRGNHREQLRWDITKRKWITGPPRGLPKPDPDSQAMYDALTEVTKLLAPWRRTGRK